MVQSPVKPLTLKEFLAQPETKPANEFINGQIIQKPMPQIKHGALQFELTTVINQTAKPKRIAYAVPELRCTFANRSLVPDIVVVRWGNLKREKDGSLADGFEESPAWVIEILSPDQSSSLVIEKILFCLQNGTEIGWLIDPYAKAITVFLCDQMPVVHLAILPDGQDQKKLPIISGLDELELTASDIFDLLKV